MPSKDPLADVDPMLFVRVKDKDTGHEYDVRAGKVKPGLQEVIKTDQYPPSQVQRDAKHNVTKAGKAATTEAGS
jgi:hypothetical protein